MRLPLLILHILAGSIALLTGTVAMAVRKGGKLHRASGNVFTVAFAIAIVIVVQLDRQPDHWHFPNAALYVWMARGEAVLANTKPKRTRRPSAPTT